MKNITFSWDERKARDNLRKHAVPFEEAVTAFSDENARLMYDPEHSQNEDRFVLLGISSKLRILIICHVYHQSEREIRIISARKADRDERKQYGEFL